MRYRQGGCQSGAVRTLLKQMERELAILNYLLASLIGLKTDDSADYWLELANRFVDEHGCHSNPISGSTALADPKKQAIEEAVEEIYSMYPTKCPQRGVATGKCGKDKARIRTLLKSKTKEEIVASISQYLDDCKASGQYLKNFGTLLNNLPEVVDDSNLFDLPQAMPNPDYR